MAALNDSIATNGYSSTVRKTVEVPGDYVQGSTSKIICNGPGILRGILISSTTTGTIKIWDNTAASGSIVVNTITPAAGTFINLGNIKCSTGIFITVANTIEYTVVYTAQ